MKYHMTTETGSVYEIDVDSGIARKNRSSFKYGTFLVTPEWHDDYWLAVDSGAEFDAHEWAKENGEDRIPKNGDCIYVHGSKAWFLSTPIVGVVVMH